MSGSSGASDDLEDGEIFDDDEQVEVFKGGGAEDVKPPSSVDSPPKEPVFKNKANSGGKKPSAKDKRSNSNETRENKRNDRSNNRNSAALTGKRKRARESDEDHRNPNKPKQRKMMEKNKGSMDEEVDENEMIYVMGGNSPPASKSALDWEMISDEEDGDREQREGERGNGRGRRGREGFHSSNRMCRRSRLGRGASQGSGGSGGGAKRNNRFPRKQNNDLTICKFFLQGKCQRGNDCQFSHTALPSKKMELCKFYMSDRCTKKDKCMYMHRDFPCKFYHTGQKCFAGKRCKFYHGKISNFLRSVLMKHLENRELQNEFDKYREQYEKKDRNRGRERFPERRPSRSDDEEGGNTPMPSPQRDEFTSERERSPTPERDREKRERRRRRKQRRSRDEEEGNREFQDDDIRMEEEYYEDHGRMDNEYNNWHDGPPDMYNNYGNENNYNDNHYNENNYNENNYNDNNFNENSEYPPDEYRDEEEQDNAIPANLPKTQRKLFMRIQQHNKKSDDRHRDDNQRDEEFKEENWYSSDEENNSNNPLNTIFQNVPGLNQMQPPVPLMNAPIQPPMMPPPMMNNQCPPPPMPLMAGMMPPHQNMVSVPHMFDNIDLSAVTKILTTVRESIQKKNDGPMLGPGGLPPSMGGLGGPMGGPSGSIGSPGPMNSPTGKLRSQESPSSSPQHNPPAQDERRFRDPRLRNQESGNDRKSSKASLPTPVLLTQADLDLRLSDPPPQSQSDSSDVDLRRLPFKPAPLHQAANEIAASINSGPPIEYKMTSVKPLKPDYASIATRSNPQTCANDPRLRKYATPQVLAQSQMVVAQAMPTGSTRMLSPPQPSTPMSPPPTNLPPPPSTRTEEVVASRDPRNRGGVSNDPRRRNQTSSGSINTSQPPPPFLPNLAPPGFGGPRPPFNQPFNSQPFPDQQSHQDNDFRLGLLPPQQQPSYGIPNMSDIDLRIQPPRYYQ